MKKLAVIILSCTAISYFAQDIKVKESSGSFSAGNAQCFAVKVYYTKPSTVQDEWKDVLDKYKNEKIKNKGNEVFADNVLIKDWGNNPVDIYTTFTDNGGSNNEVEMKVAVDLGNGNFLKSSEKDKARLIENMMRDFAVKISAESMDKQIKANEKIFGDLTDKQKNLEKKNANLNDDIKNYQQKIQKAQDDIKTNTAEIEKKKQEVAAQQKILDDLKNKKNSIK